MGVIDKLFSGGGKTLATPVEAVGNVMDKLFTSEDEKLSHKEVMERLLQRPGEVQNEINKLQAQHRSRFVAGARPFIMWVCGFALANSFLINPWIQWITGQEGPRLPMDYIMDLVMLMLGLGIYRTYEKNKGVAK